MLRDPSLIPLSHQHQHALALCVRLDRAMLAGQVDSEAFQSEIEQLFAQEISIHFAAEEEVVFPAALKFTALQPLVAELVAEHARLRELLMRTQARDLDLASLRGLGVELAAHIRKEERQLFEGMQKRMPAEDLASMGSALERALAAASNACLLPGEATRLRARR
jgi:hemerythrin-like domain-containing protein